jgi:hypothetical protein
MLTYSRPSFRPLDSNEEYAGYETIKRATSISATVVATIPPVITPAGYSLQHLLSKFININNVVAEVFCVEHNEFSIVSQVKAAVQRYPAESMTVMMPYQVGVCSRYFVHDDVSVLLKNRSHSDKPAEGIVVSIAEDSLCDFVVKDIAADTETDLLFNNIYGHRLDLIKFRQSDFINFMERHPNASFADFLRTICIGAPCRPIASEFHFT